VIGLRKTEPEWVVTLSLSSLKPKPSVLPAVHAVQYATTPWWLPNPGASGPCPQSTR